MKTFVAAECAPFLNRRIGDVAGALPKHWRKGTDIKVVLPFSLRCRSDIGINYKTCSLMMFMSVGANSIGVKYLQMNGIDYYFLDNLYYFDRPGWIWILWWWTLCLLSAGSYQLMENWFYSRCDAFEWLSYILHSCLLRKISLIQKFSKIRTV